MNKTNTPGPWTNHHLADSMVVTDMHGKMICDCMTSIREFIPEARCNAALIAAAPETAAERDSLQAEVKRLRDALEKITDPTYVEPGILRDIARAALKAGQS